MLVIIEEAWLEKREDYCSLETDSCTWIYHEACLRNVVPAVLANRQGTLGEGYLTVEANELVVKPNWDNNCHFELLTFDVFVTKVGKSQPEWIFMCMLLHPISKRFIAMDEGRYSLVEADDNYVMPVLEKPFIPDNDDPRWFFVGHTLSGNWNVFQTANASDCKSSFMVRDDDEVVTRKLTGTDVLDQSIDKVFSSERFEDFRWYVAEDVKATPDTVCRVSVGAYRELRRSFSIA